ncbi:MAG TPA: response regulator [Dongiaceae bacterium]|jgi:two-component system OmpR family response regulator|nr:response regulator [Dongiaceae bacterium]
MEKTPHILIVDDDREIRDLLSRFLQKHGFRASAAADGRDMRRILADARIDLIVLDVMMPGESGLQLCAQLRAQGIPGPSGTSATRTPIIMLTAAGEDTDRIVGLEMGADDYLPKPFNPRELLARIRAVLRRSEDAGRPLTEADRAAVLHFDGWQLDLGARRVINPEGRDIDLSAGEFDLLAVLAQRPRRVLSRDQLLDLCKGRAAQPFDRSIDVQVGRLRKKIEPDPTEPRIITTVRGGGYMFAPEVTRSGSDAPRAARDESAGVARSGA